MFRRRSGPIRSLSPRSRIAALLSRRLNFKKRHRGHHTLPVADGVDKGVRMGQGFGVIDGTRRDLGSLIDIAKLP
jgi:hypothetical protein